MFVKTFVNDLMDYHMGLARFKNLILK